MSSHQMKPERALERVQKYATLNKELKAIKKAIPDNFEKCEGLDGSSLSRKWLDADGVDQNINVSKTLHITSWYTATGCDDDDNAIYLHRPSLEECPHCFAAHLLVQRRKEVKHLLGVVKNTMSRWGA